MAIKPHPEENTLINLISTGDQRSFSELFYHYARPLSQFVFKITNNSVVTEEVIQDTFITVWLRRETLTSIDNFGGYLYTICRNNSLAALKKIAKSALVNELLTDDLKDNMIDEVDQIAEFRKLVDEAVEKLPTQQKKVYILSRYEKLKHQEIAQQLNISAETVKKHIQLAMSYLEGELKDKMNAPIIFILIAPNLF
jgi:RNA polymerase sigma-70 factor (family 1)